METVTEKIDLEKTWIKTQENSKEIGEIKLKFLDIDEIILEMREGFKDIKESFKETDAMFKEIKERFQETDVKFKETDAQFKRTDKKINKLETLFTSQWGKLMESLVEGDLIKLLNARNIKINVTSNRINAIYNKKQYEFDIIAENGEDVVVVEVKTTLKPEDVKDFIEKLQEFKTIMPKFKNNNVFGAVAYLKEDGGARILAEKKKLFVIKATGSSANITNSDDFIPKSW